MKTKDSIIRNSSLTETGRTRNVPPKVDASIQNRNAGRPGSRRHPRRETFLTASADVKRPRHPEREVGRAAKHKGRMKPGRRIIVTAISGAMALGLASGATLTALHVTPDRAEAATPAVIASGASKFGGDLGLYATPDGGYGSCGDPSRSWASGATSAGRPVTSFASDSGFTLTGADMAGVNAAMTRYVPIAIQNGDVPLAAAVNLLTYAYTGSNLGGGVQRGTYEEGAAYLAPGNAEILSKYNEVWAYAEANKSAVAAGQSGAASFAFEVDNNNYAGSMTVRTGNPAGTVPLTTLTNGVFVSTGANTTANLKDGDILSVRGVPPEDGSDYEISASGTVEVPGGAAAELMQWDTGGQQRILGPTGATTGGTYPISGKDPFSRSQKFAPKVGTTVASRFVKAGEKPQDVLAFSATDFTEAGRTIENPWAQRAANDFALVTAKGTLYGPSVATFRESATPPADALVAGHSAVTTTAEQGPTATYTATSDTTISESGYYTWVWSIDYADQSEGTKRRIPDAYSFMDRFGQVRETHVSPSQLTFTTKLSDTNKVIGEAVTDVISPTLSGGAWLQDAGDRVPVTLTGTAYYSEVEPKQSPNAPADAQPIGTVTQIIGGPTPVVSPAINVGMRDGWLTVQWSLEKSMQPEQYQGYFAEFTDDYGVPSETVRVEGPTITTRAQPVARPGSSSIDVAIVEGPLPDGGIDLTWEKFLQRPGENVVCDDSTRVWSSSRSTLVTKPGEYKSEEAPVVVDAPLGSIEYWIETGTLPGTDIVIARGMCGEPDEQTKIENPTVITIPPTGLTEGGTGRDTVKVNGPIEEGDSTTVSLYKKAPGAEKLVCTPENLVQALTPISLNPGLAADAIYESEETQQLGAGEYGFVEKTTDKDGNVLSEGGCLDELFTVGPKPQPSLLAFTGANTASAWLIAGGAGAFLLIGGALLLTYQRRKIGWQS